MTLWEAERSIRKVWRCLHSLSKVKRYKDQVEEAMLELNEVERLISTLRTIFESEPESDYDD